MKTYQIFIIILFANLCSCSLIKDKSVEQNEIFRYINIGYNRELSLGDKIEKHVRYLKKQSINSYQILGGPFDDASKIIIYVNTKNQIIKFQFAYGENTNFDSMIESYKSIIGLPKIIGKKAIWEDSKTKFIINKIADKQEVIAELIDKLNN